ncbi:pilus assembly protein N-terminal domain-containing protein [bacterium]|nr:pilus assembly protein N-terminal domain-containing protein [bacterium]
MARLCALCGNLSIFLHVLTKRWVGLLLFLSVLSAPAHAVTHRLKIPIGEFRVFNTAGDFSRLAVADPNIMDYTVISKRQILLNGKRPGNTNLHIWLEDSPDRDPIEVSVDVLDPKQTKLERLTSLEEKIEDINNNSTIQVTYTNRGVILGGKAKSEQEKQDVEKIVKAYMPDPDLEVSNVIQVWRKPRLVRMKVRILEIEETLSRTLGIDWGTMSGVSTVTTATGFHDQFTAGGSLAANIWPRYQIGLRKRFLATGLDAFMVRVNALIDSGIIRILAEPEVVALVGATSEVLIGGEIPIPVPGENNSVTIEWKQHGMTMRLTPELDDEERISADIFTELSTLDFANGVTLGGFTVPALKTTRATSKIHVKPGKTVFLSGLKRDVDSKKMTGVPGFSSLPVVGEAFLTRTRDRTTVDLIISVTPYLMEEEESDLGR